MRNSIARIAPGLATLALVAVSLLGEATAQTPEKIYWPDRSRQKILRANLDGSKIEEVVTANASNIALDLAAGKVYWTDPDRQTIRRANLNGRHVRNIVRKVKTPGGAGIAIDLANGKIYWIDSFQVIRANLDGSAVENTGVSASFIALDVANGKMYLCAGGGIRRANLDGSNIENFITASSATVVAVDGVGGKVYWVEFSLGGKIWRADIDGSNALPLVTGLFHPWTFGLDVAGGKMYWSSAGGIWRANLDGSGIERPVVGPTVPSLALDLPQFLTLPFNDAGVQLAQGWLYDSPPIQSLCKPRQPNYPVCHYAIDYLKPGGAGTYLTFDVLAAAEGRAKYLPSGSTTWGNYVQVMHTVGDHRYFSIYAHLESSLLPPNVWVPVTRGSLIGTAGMSGQANMLIHLHFEVHKDGIITGKGLPANRLDPYAVYSDKAHYPPFGNCGLAYLWTACPPLPSAAQPQ